MNKELLQQTLDALNSGSFLERTDVVRLLEEAIAQPVPPTDSELDTFKCYKLVAATSGYFGGHPTIITLESATILPFGTALYMRSNAT